MATVTRPSEALPTAGARIKSAQVTDWITNILSFLESTSIDEANVDLSGSDGIVGKSTSQTLTGLKTFECTSAAAGGVREVVQLGIDPASGTAADGDGGRVVMYADDDGGTETDLVHMDWVLTDASNGSEDAKVDISAIVAGTMGTVLELGYDSSGNAVNTIRTREAIAAAVRDVLTLEWDPDGGGNATDNSTGAALAFKLPGDDDTQDVFARIAMLCVSDVAGAEEGELSFRLVKAGTITELLTLAPTTGLTLGVDDTGYDAKFFGATAGKYMQWDESADALLVQGLLSAGANDGCALGSATVGFSDAFFASGAVLNFNNGDVTVTHAANTLTFAGATLGYQFNGAVNNAMLIGSHATDGVGAKIYPTTAAPNAIPLWVYPTYSGGNGEDRTVYAYSIASVNNSGSMQGLRTFGLINAGVTLATYYGAYIANPTVSGTLTNNYGIYLENQTSGGTNYSIYSAGGAVNIQSLGASADVQTDGSKNLTTVSDMRWKNDLGPIEKASKVLRALKPHYFTWKRDMTGDNQERSPEKFARRPRLAGFFAQEVYEVLPEGSPGGANLDEEGNERWGLNTHAIMAYIVSAWQELDARVATLEKVA